MMNNSEKRRWGDIPFWCLALALALLRMAPISLCMGIWKLFFEKKGNKSTKKEQMPLGARTTCGGSIPSKPLLSQSIRTLQRRTSLILVSGTVLSVYFFLILCATILHTEQNGGSNSLLAAIWVPLGCLLVSFCYLGSGIQYRAKLRRFSRCLSVIGMRHQCTLSELAEKTGIPVERVRQDITDMLEEGIFHGVFLDLYADRLILSH